MKYLFILLMILIACDSNTDEDVDPINLENKVLIKFFSPSEVDQSDFIALVDSISYVINKIENDSIVFSESGQTDQLEIPLNDTAYTEGVFKIDLELTDPNGIENFVVAVRDSQFVTSNRSLLWRLFTFKRNVKAVFSAVLTDSISIDLKHLNIELINLVNDTLVFDSLNLASKQVSIDNILAGTYDVKIKALIENDSVSTLDSLQFNQLLIGKETNETITEIDALFN